ncbi:hypothetical protein Bca4012_036650 [Brassica carinata]|uniref:Uncharacterized protein n=1 Tax=Brassica carinata TaxID=52824 RepID=A0A8X8BB64_BRACI|nr:hypothetical protein Bca52824_010370 [Brassica carinata]
MKQGEWSVIKYKKHGSVSASGDSSGLSGEKASRGTRGNQRGGGPGGEQKCAGGWRHDGEEQSTGDCARLSYCL